MHGRHDNVAVAPAAWRGGLLRLSTVSRKAVNGIRGRRCSINASHVANPTEVQGECGFNGQGRVEKEGSKPNQQRDHQRGKLRSAENEKKCGEARDPMRGKRGVRGRVVNCKPAIWSFSLN